jgi:DtxR family Mn-dependent transcriptional regulator
MTTKQSASSEDYLEAIAKLKAEGEEVRVTLISKRLGVKKPSVTEALQRLSQEGLVEHRKYGVVDLTTEGERIAQDVLQRHEVLFRFLSEVLGVDPETSQEDACSLEHSLSPVTHQKLTAFVEFLLAYPDRRDPLLAGFNDFTAKRKRAAGAKTRTRR